MQSMFLYFKSRELFYRVGIPAIKFKIETKGAGSLFWQPPHSAGYQREYTW